MLPHILTALLLLAQLQIFNWTLEQLMYSLKMSRAEIRFEQFRMAQQALFDAEGRLNKRLEEDLKMTEEFNAMQLELQRLLTSKTTIVCIALNPVT